MSVSEVFPYLRVKGGAAAIEFYCKAFGCTERMRLTDPSDGRVGHAELVFGDGDGDGDNDNDKDNEALVILLSDEYPEAGIVGPQSVGGTGSSVHLHVDDCDAYVARAVAAGATLQRPASDQFYGERSATLVDPFGHHWNIGSHVEQVAPEEMQRRWNEMVSPS